MAHLAAFGEVEAGRADLAEQRVVLALERERCIDRAGVQGADLAFGQRGEALARPHGELVAQAFPASLPGRANTALNLLVFAGAFGLQWGIGGFVDALQAGGWATDAAYRTAFLTLLGGQALALVWLLLPARRA